MRHELKAYSCRNLRLLLNRERLRNRLPLYADSSATANTDMRTQRILRQVTVARNKGTLGVINPPTVKPTTVAEKIRAPGEAPKRRPKMRICSRLMKYLMFLVFVASFVIGLAFALNYINRPQHHETDFKKQFDDMQMHFKLLNTKYQGRQEVLTTVQDYAVMSQIYDDAGNDMTTLSPQALVMVKNLSEYPHTLQGLKQPNMTKMRRYVDDYPLQFIDVHDTAVSNAYYKPAFHIQSKRGFVEFVVGVPSVHREKESYLGTTLRYLVEGLTAEDYINTIIVVMIGEVDLERVVDISKSIETTFNKELQDGLIEVISPQKMFYPDLKSVPLSLGDSAERVQWRTKQNLDAIFLMSYAKSKGMYYLILEDDVITKANYMQEIKTFAAATTLSTPDWLIIEFCRVGGIGKLIRTPDMAHFKSYVELFYMNMPFDWLIDSYVANKVCRVDKDLKDCQERKAKVRLQYKTSVFQHIGLHSSLRGKIQKIKDPKFGELPQYIPHVNPLVSEIKTSLEGRSDHTIKDAYEGKTFFWGVTPGKDDFVEFIFKVPTSLKSFTIRSGNYQNVGDIFKDTDVTAKLAGDTVYHVIGTFNSVGVATGLVPESYGPIAAIKIVVNSNSDKWVIISEIHLETFEESQS